MNVVYKRNIGDADEHFSALCGKAATNGVFGWHLYHHNGDPRFADKEGRMRFDHHPACGCGWFRRQ